MQSMVKEIYSPGVFEKAVGEEIANREGRCSEQKTGAGQSIIMK